MENSNIQIVKSFKVQNELSPEIWFLEGDTYKMKPEIRTSLLEIVEDYENFTDLDYWFFI